MKNYFQLLRVFDIIPLKEGVIMSLIVEIINNVFLQIMLILIALDSIFGICRAIKEKELNSSIGIDGILRKVLMIISVIFFLVIDHIGGIDFIAFLPVSLKELLRIEKIGIGSLFNILFILFEILSILKNMINKRGKAGEDYFSAFTFTV